MTNQFEQELRQQIQALPKEQMPEKDLWKGIELAIEQESNRSQQTDVQVKRQTPLYAMAASVLAIGFVGWLSWQQPVEQQVPPSLVEMLASQHQQQKEALLVKFDGQPALTNNWQNQLQELDDAADAIKKALKQEPNNMALLKMLQQVHQQQIDLIERVHAPKWRQI